MISGEPLLSVEGLNKWYGPLQVLHEVSLQLAAHERVAICGPSGSGKTTLLRCLNGLEPHQSGRIVIQGTEINSEAATLNLVRREVGLVFQAFNLFPHLTALENCTLAPIWARKTASAEANDLALSYLARLNLSGLRDKYPSQLSGGEQQRVAIARALCMSPKVMMFDEPTSALDPEMTQQMLDIVADLANSGMTMILVTHEMSFARRAADRIVFMDHGKIVEHGTADQMFDSPKTERLATFLKAGL